MFTFSPLPDHALGFLQHDLSLNTNKPFLPVLQLLHITGEILLPANVPNFTLQLWKCDTAHVQPNSTLFNGHGWGVMKYFTNSITPPQSAFVHLLWRYKAGIYGFLLHLTNNRSNIVFSVGLQTCTASSFQLLLWLNIFICRCITVPQGKSL